MIAQVRGHVAVLEIRLLGAVELRLNSQQIDAGPARQRTVLAVATRSRTLRVNSQLGGPT